MSLNKNNIEIIKNFNLFKIEIFNLLDKKLLDKTHRQNYLYFVVAPVFNYTEAIIILCENNKFNAAQVLLRSLFETHINIQYYMNSDNTDKNLAIAAKAQFDWNKTVVSSFLQLISKYKNLKSKKPDNIYNNNYLQEILLHTNKKRDALIKSYNLIGEDIKRTPIICTKCKNYSYINNKKYIKKEDNDPSVLQKAILCDDYKIKGTEPGRFESMYHLVYRQLSSYTHLDLPGITSFINKDDNGDYSFKERSDENSLIANSVDICIELVKDLYKYKVIKGKESNLIKILKKLISN